MNPLGSITGATLAGLTLVAVLALALPGGFEFGSLDRLLHIMAGILWLGLLCYFNVVQIPALAAASSRRDMAASSAINKYIVPPALLWFRWAAVATVLTGIIFIEFSYRSAGGSLGQVLMLEVPYVTIGIGSWLGIIMALNAWLVLWPCQKKLLGLTAATDAQKAQARTTAVVIARLNLALSFPMLMCMGGQSHGLPF